MNVEEHYFEAYVDAIKLCRWFILIVVLLSGLLLVQLYVEESNEGKIEEQRDLIHHVWAKELGLTPVTIANTTNITQRLNVLKGLHFYETASFGEQRLPLLDFSVPGDYYETILSILLAVFSVGVWLNVRSVLATRSLLLD